MEEVAAVRRTALDAVGDVEPGRLRERIRGRIEDGSMAPGVLTLLSARAAFERGADAPTDLSADSFPDPPADSFPEDPVAKRGAGVQLIYEGLRLTRSLSQDPPWERGDERDPEYDREDDPGGEPASTDGGDVTLDGGATATDPAVEGVVDPDVADADAEDADMAILVADVMVARGFYLLARTEAAGTAVRTVQSFGRDQTVRRTTGDAALDRDLEADVFELAVVAGTTAVGGSASESLREYVTDLARTDGDAPTGALSLSDGLFSESTVETISGHLADGGVPTSTD